MSAWTGKVPGRKGKWTAVRWTCHYGLQPWAAKRTACGWLFCSGRRGGSGRSEILENVNCARCKQTLKFRAALSSAALERCA